MRRGFAVFGERLALETRSELDLTPPERFDPARLAEHLAIPVVWLSNLAAVEPDAVQHLLGVDPSCFSAATVFRGTRRIIVCNDRHTTGRQANSLAHELSHVLLEHVPVLAFDDYGNRRWDGTQEDEANWLAGCLLSPRSGMLIVMSSVGHDLKLAADHFGVSVELLRWRWNKTGAAIQMKRARSRGL